MIWNNQTIIIHEGQFITGRKQLSEESGISETTIERVLEYLEKEGQIGQQKTTKYRIITIVNWKDYQTTDNKRTTNGQQAIQQADTNKNDKNDKNEENDKKNTKTVVLGNDFINLFKGINPTYQYLFARNNQREASNRLLKLRSQEEWAKVIAFIASRRNDRFCPRISTPIQLEQKYAELESYALTIKEKTNKNKIYGL